MFWQGKSFQLVQLPLLWSKAYTFKVPGKPASRSIPAGGRRCTRFPPHPHLRSASHLHSLTAHCAHSGQLTLRTLHLLTRSTPLWALTTFFLSSASPSLQLLQSFASRKAQHIHLVWQRRTTCTFTPALPHGTKGEQDLGGVLCLPSNKDSFTSTYDWNSMLRVTPWLPRVLCPPIHHSNVSSLSAFQSAGQQGGKKDRHCKKRNPRRCLGSAHSPPLHCNNTRCIAPACKCGSKWAHAQNPTVAKP